MREPVTRESRRLGLGIDTGGTFTDAAVVDLDGNGVLAKAKAPTTYHDLSQGLVQAVDGVLSQGGFDPSEVGLVGLSTTLATNSLLQGRGWAVGLVGIGWRPEPEWRLGAARSRFIAGGHDVRGRPLVPLDLQAAEAAVDELSDLDAIAVSSFFSVVNPAHEEAVRSIVRRKRDVPVVAGHELTAELGIMERTVTAVLNASLLPIIDEFLRGVESSLQGKGVSAPVMVLRGDGTLMNLKKARERPVETILSGPAASLMGGLALSRQGRCIVMDIGGTSTDIAYLDEGFPRLRKEGASVGQWRTRVRAIDIWTAALGGDSRLDLVDGRMTFGPERALPLAMACEQEPSLLERMSRSSEVEYLVAFPQDASRLIENERRVYEEILGRGPLTPKEAVEAMEGIHLVPEYIRRLKTRNFLISTGLTPTDVLHVAGIYLHGSRPGAELGVRIVAARHGLVEEEFVSEFMRSIRARVAEELLRKAILDASGEQLSGKAGTFMLDSLTGLAGHGGLRLSSILDRPIVGIGAPAHVYLPMAAPLLGTEVVIPSHHDVGNAVGAVCSLVSDSVEVQIHKRDNCFYVYLPDREPLETETLETALYAAKEGTAELVRRRVEEAGGTDISVLLEVEMKRCRTGVSEAREILNWVEVRGRATGRPTIVDNK